MKYEPDQFELARAEGWSAGYCGLPIRANPYRKGWGGLGNAQASALATAWDEGWDEGSLQAADDLYEKRKDSAR